MKRRRESSPNAFTKATSETRPPYALSRSPTSMQAPAMTVQWRVNASGKASRRQGAPHGPRIQVTYCERVYKGGRSRKERCTHLSLNLPQAHSRSSRLPCTGWTSLTTYSSSRSRSIGGSGTDFGRTVVSRDGSLRLRNAAGTQK